MYGSINNVICYCPPYVRDKFYFVTEYRDELWFVTEYRD